jgi:penicillin-insensitive murein endopeptidase
MPLTLLSNTFGSRRTRRRACLAAGLLIAAVGGIAWLSGGSSDHPSTCFGTTSQGALREAWKLPRAGENFRVYSAFGWFGGRTFVHSSVHAIVLESYERLAARMPAHRFVYGETGRAEGGRFRPHRTHQNGLSVDFMVPVRDASGAVRELPTSALDRFGYGHEFDAAGKLGDLHIDFEAIGVHLSELSRAAAARRVRIARVIFAPELLKHLRRTPAWSGVEALPFMSKPAWIRHDEHYHVDFAVACEPLPANAGEN